MKIGNELLYLSDAEVVACGCTPAQLNDAIENAFRMKAKNTAWTARELSMPDGLGNKYAGKGGGLSEPALACMKWYGYFSQNPQVGLHVFNSLIVLNEGKHGLPVAVMNGTWISQARTASITATAAKYMARPESKHVAFIGCGGQARSHLNALRACFGIERISAYSRTLQSAQKFVDAAEREGLAGTAFDDPRKALEGSDIVITVVPRLAQGNPFMQASWVPEGAFVGIVELGYAWQPESLLEFDRVVTDDLQAVQAGETLKLNYPGQLQAGLAEIVSGAVPGRLRPEERNGIVFAGTGLADVAAAALVYEAAQRAGLGTLMPL